MMRKITVKTGKPRSVNGVRVELIRVLGPSTVVVAVAVDDGAGPDDGQKPKQTLRDSVEAMERVVMPNRK